MPQSVEKNWRSFAVRIGSYLVAGVAINAISDAIVPGAGILVGELLSDLFSNPESILALMECISDSPAMLVEAMSEPETIARMVEHPEEFLRMIEDPDVASYLRENPKLGMTLANMEVVASSPELTSQLCQIYQMA